MADIEQVFYSILAGDGTVAALVSTRIYPLLVPQDVALPAISYQKISGPRDYNHDGAAGFVKGRIQVTAVDDSYDGVKALFAAIRGALSGYTGTVSGVRIWASFLENEIDSQGREDRFFVTRSDWRVNYSE